MSKYEDKKGNLRYSISLTISDEIYNYLKAFTEHKMLTMEQRKPLITHYTMKEAVREILNDRLNEDKNWNKLEKTFMQVVK